MSEFVLGVSAFISGFALGVLLSAEIVNRAAVNHCVASGFTGGRYSPSGFICTRDVKP